MAVTTITKTIGTTGRQYSTLQAWEDGAPTDLTTAEKSAAGTFAVTTFVSGEALTFVGSGATGKFLLTDSTGVGNGTYILYGVLTGNIAASDVATGGTSGATCVITSGTPTDTGVIWRGEAYNDSQFTAAVLIEGSTSSATTYKELTVAAGQSFADNAGVRTNALRFNATNGVSISFTAGYNTAVLVRENHARISRLQIKSTASTSRALGLSTAVQSADGGFTGLIAEDCIADGHSAASNYSKGVAIIGSNCTLRNCLIVRTAGDNPGITAFGATLVNCTVVNTNATTTGLSIVAGSYATITLIRNCAAFNFATAPSASTTSQTNYTNVVSPPAGWTGSIAYSTATFVNITAAAEDFRIPTGSALIDVGTTDTTNGTPDISLTARPIGSAYDVGCWEASAAAASTFTPKSWVPAFGPIFAQ